MLVNRGSKVYNFSSAKALVKLRNQTIVHYQLTFLRPLFGLDINVNSRYLILIRKEELKRKSFFRFQSFWIPFFLISKSTLYEGVLKELFNLLTRCMQKKNLHYTEIYTIDLCLIDVKSIEK